MQNRKDVYGQTGQWLQVGIDLRGYDAEYQAAARGIRQKTFFVRAERAMGVDSRWGATLEWAEWRAEHLVAPPGKKTIETQDKSVYERVKDRVYGHVICRVDGHAIKLVDGGGGTAGGMGHCISVIAECSKDLLGPHSRTDPTRDTRVAEPRLPAPEDRQLGEGQRLTQDAPHNGGRPPPPGTAPHRPRSTQPPQGMQAKGTVLGPDNHTPAPTACGWRTPTSRPVGGQFGEGERLTTDAPHNGGRHPPGNVLLPPPQRATPARKGACCGADAGSHARTDRTRDTRVAEPRPPAPEGGRLGEGQRLTPDAPHNGGRPTPPGTAPHHPHGTQPPQGMQAKGTVMGPHTHTLAPAAPGWRTPTARPVGGQSGEGERLTSDAPRNSGGQPPRGRPNASPAARSPHRACRQREQRWAPTPTRPRPQHVGSGPQQPTQGAGSRGRGSA